MGFNRLDTNVENIQHLDDRPQITAQDLKACFDQAGVDIKIALNSLMNELESLYSAGYIGATALGDEYEATSVQGILAELKVAADLLKSTDNITATEGEGYPIESLTNRLNRIKVAIDNIIMGQLPADSITNNQLAKDAKVGSLANLLTTNKDNAVNSINELYTRIIDIISNLSTKANKADIQVKSFTIETTDWHQENELYVAFISDASIKETDMSDISIDNETYSIAEDAGVKAYTVEVEGGIKLFSESVPTDNITGKYVVNRGEE